MFLRLCPRRNLERNNLIFARGNISFSHKIICIFFRSAFKHTREEGIYKECTYLRERKTHMSLATTGSEPLVSIPTLTPALIEEMVKRIVNAVHPDQIVLFGSYAYGIPHEDSDIDILVIMETDRPRHKRSVILNQVLAGLIIPKDLLVYTPEEVAEWKDVPQAFITQILTKGVILYDKNKRRSDPCMV